MKTENDMICLTGKTYEAREYSGVVVAGRWYDADDDRITPEVKARVEKTLAATETQDAPVDVIQNDGEETDYYYNILA